MTTAPLWDKSNLESPHRVDDKARRVRAMFDAIAPRYEQVNRVFSGGLDARWRKRAVALAQVTADDIVLDLACGTGDFVRAVESAGPVSVIGCDFSHEMLVRALHCAMDHGAQPKANKPRPFRRQPFFVEADALVLPFPDGVFTLVTCAFGVRNFAVLQQGLTEMRRVLQTGGRLLILEFSRPTIPFIRGAYEFYSRRIMPAAASWFSGDRTGAYRYLPQSVVCFPDAAQFQQRIRDAGFAEVSATPLTLGVVTVYVASCG